MRYEKKFILNSKKDNNFINWLHKSKYLFYKQFNSRYVNSIYFDDFNNTSLIQNIEGFENKTKLRIRWYNNLNKMNSVNLELKIKRNKYTIKDLYKIEKQINLINYSYKEFKKIIYDNIPDKYKYYLNKFNNPIGITRYKRDYYASRQYKNLRITFDKDLHFYKNNNQKKINTKAKSYSLDSKIVELKYNDTHLNKNISNILNDFPTYTQKFSKYFYLNKYFL